MIRKQRLAIATILGMAAGGLVSQAARADYVWVQYPNQRVQVWGPYKTYDAHNVAADVQRRGGRASVSPYNSYPRKPTRPFAMNPAPGFRGPRHAGY